MNSADVAIPAKSIHGEIGILLDLKIYLVNIRGEKRTASISHFSNSLKASLLSSNNMPKTSEFYSVHPLATV